ncbi:unnamed protein product [Durusdinium trenchii]|uniref:Uncharacterized protein n=1 Tax=Durusdinium trenchii TaxID=1381693 RepID=A0ABP0SR97_9DINO
MTTKMLQKVCSYRMGLVAGLLSRIRGREVALMICDYMKTPSVSKNEVIVDLIDQRAGDMRKQGARVRLVDEQMVSARWKSKLTQLLNSLPSHQKHEYHQLIDEMDSDPGMSVPTRVAIGVRTWAANHHMVSMARHGIRASADGHCHIRSLGFQEINVCKDRVGPSRPAATRLS